MIRGQIRARQRIIGFRSERDDKGRAYCLIEVDAGAGRDRLAAVAAVSGLALSAARRTRRRTAPGGGRAEGARDAGGMAGGIAGAGPDVRREAPIAGSRRHFLYIEPLDREPGSD